MYSSISCFFSRWSWIWFTFATIAIDGPKSCGLANGIGVIITSFSCRHRKRDKKEHPIKPYCLKGLSTRVLFCCNHWLPTQHKNINNLLLFQEKRNFKYPLLWKVLWDSPSQACQGSSPCSACQFLRACFTFHALTKCWQLYFSFNSRLHQSRAKQMNGNLVENICPQRTINCITNRK